MPTNSIIPRDKHDIAAIKRAKAIGFPALNEYIPQYLGWLQDGNWPVADPVSELLVTAGPEIVPHIIEILQGDDAGRSYFLIVTLIQEFKTRRPECFAEIEPELVRIKDNPTEFEISECVHEMVVDLFEHPSSSSG